ncbi:MAG: family 16 glycosylhydrolase, partial [Bacteroidota bacterium]
GWGNNEIQNYTNLTQNSRQEGGVLIIQALKQGYSWTSARLLTRYKFTFTYGTVVFRAKLPTGSGTWPALWMLGANLGSVGWPACGEVDVMEHVGKDPGWVHSSIHTPSSYGATVNTQPKFVKTFDTVFHSYQVKWTPEKIEFSIDSVPFYTYNPAVKNSSTWPFDKACFLIMNVAMGGNWGSDPQYETGGLKNGINPSLNSATMTIDYVRVYQTKPYPFGIGDPSENGTKGKSDKINFSPNPTDGKFRITIPAGLFATGTIYNLNGTNVSRFTANTPVTELDLSSFPKGLYCIRMQSEGTIYTKRLILK